MKYDTFKNLPEKTRNFIIELQDAKIPLKDISTNDFSCNTKPSIYITIPYGKENGGKCKRISNNYLNTRSRNSAIQFYHGYNIQDEIWESRKWNKWKTEYIDLSN